jgi:hypothetical protein
MLKSALTAIRLKRVVFDARLGDTHRMQRYSSQRAVRLNFSYSNAQITLESKQAIEKVVPASDPLEDGQPASGFWFELRDAAEARVFRRFAHSPIEDSTEIYPPNGRGPITRIPKATTSGVFSLIVPVLSQARFVVIHDSPRGQGRHLAAQEIARFDISADMQSEARP